MRGGDIMQVASLGGIVFEVSEDTIKTLQTIKLTGGASIARHDIHLGRSEAEFTGIQAGTLTLKCMVSRELGVEPKDEIDRIEAFCHAGRASAFVLGKSSYGGQWMIAGYTVDMKRYDMNGELNEADITLSLEES